MLYAFGFEKVGVVVGDLYFVDPRPPAGQEGAERGVRLEVRMIERPAPRGSVYSALPINVERPIWRADLLETVEGPPGSHDRTHHHPDVSRLGAGPAAVRRPGRPRAGGLGGRAARRSRRARGAIRDRPERRSTPTTREQLRDAVPEILEVLRRLLERVRAGELATAPNGSTELGARRGWL